MLIQAEHRVFAFIPNIISTNDYPSLHQCAPRGLIRPHGALWLLRSQRT